MLIAVLCIMGVGATKYTDLYYSSFAWYYANDTSSMREVIRETVNASEITGSTASYQLSGFLGYSIGLNGTDRLKVKTAVSGAFARNNSDWSLCYWMKIQANATGSVWGANTSNTAHGRLEAWYNHGGTYPIRVDHYCDGANRNLYQYNAYNAFGGWNHYCFVFYRNGTDSLELWVNGINLTLSAITPSATCGKMAKYNISGFYFGEYGGTNAHPYKFQHIGFYDQALNASQIDWLENNKSAINSAHIYPFGVGGGGPALTVTLVYPNTTDHYNNANYDGSIELYTNIAANCIINDTTRWSSYFQNATTHLWVNNTVLASRNYTISYACNSTATTWSNGSFWFVFDTVMPSVTQVVPANNSYMNDNFTLTVRFYDLYLYFTNITIKDTIGTVRYNRAENFSTGSAVWNNVTKLINITGWPEGDYIITSEAWDTHTLAAFEEPIRVTTSTKSNTNVYDYAIKTGTFKLTTPKTTTIETIAAPDRWKFRYTSTKTGAGKFNISASSLVYLSESPFPCHFIVNKVYWFDAAGLDNCEVRRIDSRTYEISYSTTKLVTLTDSFGGLNHKAVQNMFNIDLSEPLWMGNRTTSTTSTATYEFNTTEATNYSVDLSNVSCGGDGGVFVDSASDAAFDVTHSQGFAGLNLNSTYYANVTVWDMAGNRAYACFEVNTTAFPLEINYIRVYPVGNQLMAYANATIFDGFNISFHCTWFINGTADSTFNYPTPLTNVNTSTVYYQELQDAYALNSTSPFLNFANIFDQDYTTYGAGTGSAAHILYNKPVGLRNAPISWQIRDNSSGSKLNLTVPDACIDYDPTTLRFRIYASALAANFVKWFCCNSSHCQYGNESILIREAHLTNRIYEEGVFWPVNGSYWNTVAQNEHYNIANLTPTSAGSYTLQCYATNYVINSSRLNSTALYVPTMNVTLRNEKTNAIITGVTFTYDLMGLGANWSRSNDTATGYVRYPDLPAIDTARITYYATGYSSRDVLLDFRDPLRRSITLYALPDNASDMLTVTVRDFGLTGISGAEVALLRYYANVSSWIEVARETTNSQGQAVFSVEQGSAYYKLIVEYANQTIFSTTGEKLYSSSYIITTDYNPIYRFYRGVEATLQIINASNPWYFRLEYNDKEADISSVCLKTYLVSNVTLTLHNTTCLNTESGVIIHPFNQNYSFTSYAYANYLHSPVYTFATLSWTGIQAFFKDTGFKDVGLVIAIVLFLSLVMGTAYLTQSPSVMIIAVDLGLLAVYFLHLFPVSLAVLGIVIPGSFVVLYFLNKVTL